MTNQTVTCTTDTNVETLPPDLLTELQVLRGLPKKLTSALSGQEKKQTLICGWKIKSSSSRRTRLENKWILEVRSNSPLLKGTKMTLRIGTDYPNPENISCVVAIEPSPFQGKCLILERADWDNNQHVNPLNCGERWSGKRIREFHIHSLEVNDLLQPGGLLNENWLLDSNSNRPLVARPLPDICTLDLDTANFINGIATRWNCPELKKIQIPQGDIS